MLLLFVPQGWRLGPIQGETSDIDIRWCAGNTSLDGTRAFEWEQQYGVREGMLIYIHVTPCSSLPLYYV